MSAELLLARRKGAACCTRHDTGRTETYGMDDSGIEPSLSKITTGGVERSAGVHAAT